MDENGLFLPEYVNVFGVPLSIFQDVGEERDAKHQNFKIKFFSFCLFGGFYRSAVRLCGA